MTRERSSLEPLDPEAVHVATEEFQAGRLVDTELPPTGSGFLDGVNAELVAHRMDDDVAVGVFVTPVHPQVPDAEAAIRLVDAVSTAYDIDVDTAPLQEFSERIAQYYAELADRVDAADESQRPDERMFM